MSEPLSIKRPRNAGRSIRVIQCANYGGPYAGSFVPMLAAAAREAASRGHPTTVLLSAVARERPWLPDLRAHAEVRLLRAGGARAAAAAQSMRELESIMTAHAGPVVIHTHFGMFDIPAVLMRLRPRRGLAVFWHEHSLLWDDPRTRLRNTIRFAGLGQLVSEILCVSPELRADVRACHAPARKLLAFPNAIDTGRFSPITSAERSEARRSLGLPDQSRVVLHFGWDWQLKGGDLMLAAARILDPEPDLVVLTVLGEDRASVPSLEADSVVRPLSPANDVERLYAAADVFLSCSPAEGALPLAVLEALARGLPVVATDIPVQARLLAGLPGAATVPSEPGAIAAAIQEMLALGEPDRAEHAELARQSLASFFALDAWASRLVDLYESAVAGRGIFRSTNS